MTEIDPEAHKEEMKKLQKAQAKKRRELKNPERGLVLVHTGNGKGKSSSAFGVIARALGWGQRVAVVQFIKGNWKTGEKTFFTQFSDLLDWHVMGDGFTWDTQDREKDIIASEYALAKASELIGSDEYALVVLDEINIALRYNYLSVDDVIAALETRGETHVILTGRDAKDGLIEYADTVTEMTEIKHAFHAGIRAQQGVDF